MGRVVEVVGPVTLDQALAAVRQGGEIAAVCELIGFAGPIDIKRDKLP